MNRNRTPKAQAPVIEMQNGQAVTTTLEIANYFKKRHKTVLRAVEKLCEESGADRTRHNFVPGYYTLPKTGDQEHRMYTLTRDGFVMLAMGFTGQQAKEFKWAYIDAFNAMEASLLQEKIWMGGLTQALEHICPTPPREADIVRNQRALKMLRAQAAYWAMLEEMPLAAAESAVCAVGRLRRLDNLDLSRHQFSEMSDFLERVIVHSNKDTQPATEEQINTIKCLVEACAQFRYSRDRNVYDLLQEEYGVSIETIVAASSGEAKRIAGIAYNMLHQHLAQTMTINEIKRRARQADNKSSGSEKEPPLADDGEEQS